jgi:hypothetical protein
VAWTIDDAVKAEGRRVTLVRSRKCSRCGKYIQVGQTGVVVAGPPMMVFHQRKCFEGKYVVDQRKADNG